MSPQKPGTITRSITDLLHHVHDGQTIDLEFRLHARGLLKAREEMPFSILLDERSKLGGRVAGLPDIDFGLSDKISDE
jgi:hypothetical protein